VIYTIGHSTHTAGQFLDLLRAHEIRQVADIRAIPQSRRHPHFGQAALRDFLQLHGITYRHFPDLGGRRRPRPDSSNTAWRVDAFRGYADYMQTEPFQRAVDSLLHFAAVDYTTVMCAESVWWRCHRRLLADALLVREVPVLHILSGAAPKPHEVSEFARVDQDLVTYPGLI
jgi:uncharacterized protein (DUF488 family)